MVSEQEATCDRDEHFDGHLANGECMCGIGEHGTARQQQLLEHRSQDPDVGAGDIDESLVHFNHRLLNDCPADQHSARPNLIVAGEKEGLHIDQHDRDEIGEGLAVAEFRHVLDKRCHCAGCDRHELGRALAGVQSGGK